MERRDSHGSQQSSTRERSQVSQVSVSATGTDVNAAMISVVERLVTQAEFSALPTVGFSGSPADYTRFINNFMERVGSKQSLSSSLSESSKLTQLLKVTQAEAREAIELFRLRITLRLRRCIAKTQVTIRLTFADRGFHHRTARSFWKHKRERS